MAKPTYAALDKNSVLTAHFEDWLSNEPVNQYYKKRPISEFLMENRETASGGVFHKAPIFDAIDPVGGAVARGGDINMTAVDEVTQVETRLVMIQEPVVIWLHDELEAMNGDGLTSLAETKVKAGMFRAWDNLERMLCATSTAAGEVTALQEIIKATGSTMGLSATDNTSWASHAANTYSFASVGPAKWRTAMRETGKFVGVGEVDKIFCGDTVYDAVKAAGYAKTTWFQDTNTGRPEYNLGAGPRLMFDTAEIIHAPRLDVQTALFINSRHLKMVVQSGYGVQMTPWSDMTQGKKLGRMTNILLFANPFCDCRASLGINTVVSA